MKRVIKRVEGGAVKDGCLDCEFGDLRGYLKEGEEEAVFCVGCGAEFSAELRGDVAAVRRPYGCSEWTALESSNLAAAGIAGANLVIRFNSGVDYNYPGGADLFHALCAAESAGKFFHRKVRPRNAVRLCARYGCPSAAGPQKFCAAHSKN